MNQHYFDVPFAFGGDVTAIPDPLQTGGTVSFTEGWNYNYQRDLATDPAALPIDRSTMNWLLLQITTALQALQQTGCPEFITSAQNGGTAFSYGMGSRVLWSASGSAPFTKFVNLNANNTNIPSLSDPTGATTGWQIDVDPISTSAQAAAGTDNASIMTPLLVAQQTALRALLAGSATQVFNVGPATSATHAPEASQVQQNAFNYAGLAGGTANALTATITPAPIAYTDDLVVVVRTFGANTGALTLNVNGLGIKNVVGQAHQALGGNETANNGFACFAYSTALGNFVLLWATGGAEQVGTATLPQHAATLAQVQQTSPAGRIEWFATLSAPTGFLAADGSAVSRATYATLFSTIAVAATGTTTNTSNSVTGVAGASSNWIGFPISGAGIPTGTTISNVSGTTLTLSNNATASASGVALTIAPFGVGDGSTTFNVPDMRGKVPRGWDNGAGVDPGRVFGSYQADSFASHSHTATSTSTTTGQSQYQLWDQHSGTSTMTGSGSSGVAYQPLTLSTTTSTTVNATGGTETRGKNVALLACIKY